MHTAQSVYKTSVATLSKSERLKLAALILDELTASAGAALDFSDSWTEEDMHDIAAYAAGYATEVYGEEADRA